MNIIYDTQSTINENINLKLNGLRPLSEASEGLKNLNGKWIQVCMRGFRPFSGSPGLRAGSGAADFLHARHPIPQFRSAPAGGWEPCPRSWPWSWRGAGKSGWPGSMFALSGPEGVRPRPGRVVGKQGWPGSVPVRRDPGACLPDKAGVCLSGSREGSRMPIRVSAGPKAGERPGRRREMRGPVTRTASSVCRKGALAAGTGALPCLPAKMKGAPKGSLPHQKLTLKNYPLFGRPP